MPYKNKVIQVDFSKSQLSFSCQIFWKGEENLRYPPNHCHQRSITENRAQTFLYDELIKGVDSILKVDIKVHNATSPILIC